MNGFYYRFALGVVIFGAVLAGCTGHDRPPLASDPDRMLRTI